MLPDLTPAAATDLAWLRMRLGPRVQVFAEGQHYVVEMRRANGLATSCLGASAESALREARRAVEEQAGRARK